MDTPLPLDAARPVVEPAGYSPADSDQLLALGEMRDAQRVLAPEVGACMVPDGQSVLPAVGAAAQSCTQQQLDGSLFATPHAYGRSRWR